MGISASKILTSKDKIRRNSLNQCSPLALLARSSELNRITALPKVSVTGGFQARLRSHYGVMELGYGSVPALCSWVSRGP